MQINRLSEIVEIWRYVTFMLLQVLTYKLDLVRNHVLEKVIFNLRFDFVFLLNYARQLIWVIVLENHALLVV